MNIAYTKNDPKNFGKALYCLYQGNSMFPVFQGSDLLEIVPVSKEELRLGDIIAFCPSSNRKMVVHRIVKIHQEGMMTRGDNNPSSDISLIAHASVVGRVRASYRNGKRKTLHRGTFILRLTAMRRRLRGLKFIGTFLSLLRPLYNFCSRRALVASLLPVRFKPRIVRFQSHAMPSFQLLLGNRVIGHYHVHRKQWSIHRPFRLLVNERKLPEPQVFEIL